MFKLHPWAEGIRYGRCGGKSMAIAVRIARAAAKDQVAFSGYHGWSDWYLSCNLADDHNLDGHLLKGLDPNGVPRGLINTSLPFEYNNIAKLEELLQNNDIGVIILEPYRHELEKDDFIQKVRDIADQIGAILVFDEVTSGFRQTFGGYHLLRGVTPDIAVFAKAMSNGFPMGAIIGKREVMEATQTSFISSTILDRTCRTNSNFSNY